MQRSSLIEGYRRQNGLDPYALLPPSAEQQESLQEVVHIFGLCPVLGKSGIGVEKLVPPRKPPR